MSAIPQPSFEAPASVPTRTPYVEVWRNTTQNIPNTSWTALSWTEAFSDSHGFWAATAPTRLTVPSGLSGLYAYEFQWEAAGSGLAAATFLAVRLNGTLQVASTSAGSVSSEGRMRISGHRLMDGGSYIEGCLYQASGGAYIDQSFAVGSDDPASPFMNLTRLAALS